MIWRAAALLAAASPAAALDLGNLSLPERAAFRAELRALLLAEPDLIGQVLTAARPDPMSFHIAEDKRRLSELDPQIAPAAGDMVINPTGAPTITAFLGADSGSREMAAALRNVANGEQAPKIVVKLWGANSATAAIGQTYGPDAFWQALLGETDREWDHARVQAKAATLDTDRSDLAQALELDAAPFLLINGIMIKGPVPEVVIRKYLSQ